MVLERTAGIYIFSQFLGIWRFLNVFRYFTLGTNIWELFLYSDVTRYTFRGTWEPFLCITGDNHLSNYTELEEKEFFVIRKQPPKPELNHTQVLHSTCSALTSRNTPWRTLITDGPHKHCPDLMETTWPNVPHTFQLPRQLHPNAFENVVERKRQRRERLTRIMHFRRTL